jgi:predicted lipoprotein with Yx(FWY)xxD motif
MKVKSLLVLVVLVLIASTVFVVSPTKAQSDAPLVTVSSTPELGKFLVGKDGLTLYSFTPDPVNESTCYDKCAEAWPPLLVDSADKITVGEGIPGTFGTTTRKDNTLQVTYNGIPLYYWFRDKKAGDTTGIRVQRVWWLVPPATAYPQRLKDVGNVLVGDKGMTLYLFKKDAPDTSNCYDKCAENWPPLTVKDAADFIPGVNLVGKFGTAARKDGTLQVTYNGWPLYYYKNDKAIGDANGEGVGEVWYTIPAETIGVAANKDLGDLLVSYDGMTLYTFANDTAGVSNCKDDCLKNWPAFTVAEGEKLIGAAALTGKLETIKRDDGTLQVTYNGMPLYFYKNDKAPGDANGDKVGNVWNVVKP